jgi:hypothetical protein
MYIKQLIRPGRSLLSLVNLSVLFLEAEQCQEYKTEPSCIGHATLKHVPTLRRLLEGRWCTTFRMLRKKVFIYVKALRLRPVGARRQWPSPSVENPSWDYPQTCTIGLLYFCWYRCIMNIHCTWLYTRIYSHASVRDVQVTLRGSWGLLIVRRIHRVLNWCSYRTKLLFDQWDEILSVGFFDNEETKNQSLLLS